MANLREWITDPDNLEKYKKWRDDPITRIILDGIAEECRPKLMPLQHVSGEMALNLLGQNVGEHRVLSRILNLDEVEMTPENVIATYNLERNLVDVGYTHEEAQKLAKKYAEEGV